MIEIKRKASQTAQKRAEMPVLAPGREPAIKNTPEAQTALKRPLKPFVAINGSNYRAAYRAVCDFHERHNPPRIDNDSGLEYWEAAADDMTAVAKAFHDDPFVIEMLVAVYSELEREYKRLTDGGAGNDANNE